MTSDRHMESDKGMAQPKVSVVITCYKYANFLPFAIESVLNQSWRNVELVMVNDGSPDNTDEVMQRFKDDPRVVYVNQNNAGQAVAKNNGIRRATGQYIAFLDADDIWELDKLEKQLPLFSDPQVGVVYGRVVYIDEENNPVYFAEDGSRVLLKPQQGWITEALFLDNFVPFSGCTVRRECFERVGLLDESYRMGIDWDIWLRISIYYKFSMVDAVVLRYRVGHAGQMSKNLDVREVDTMRIMRQFIAANPERLPAALITRAFAYTYCNRGYRQRPLSLVRSVHNYLRAIREDWQCWDAYMGIVKTFVYRALVPFGLIPRQK